MLSLTREWVAKAESDYDGACEALRSRKKSRSDRICFFSQQCGEKYLKARLTEGGITFQKTHELSILLQLCLPIEPLWASFDRAFASHDAVCGPDSLSGNLGDVERSPARHSHLSAISFLRTPIARFTPVTVAFIRAR